jgi:hypothetical protein
MTVSAPVKTTHQNPARSKYGTSARTIATAAVALRHARRRFRRSVRAARPFSDASDLDRL